MVKYIHYVLVNCGFSEIETTAFFRTSLIRHFDFSLVFTHRLEAKFLWLTDQVSSREYFKKYFHLIQFIL